MSLVGHEQTWSIAEVAKRKAARRRLLNSGLIILETTGAKTDNDTHVAKKSLCKVSPLAQRPCKFHNTRTGTENCRDVDCRLGRSTDILRVRQHVSNVPTAGSLPMSQWVGAPLGAVSFVALQPPRRRSQTRWHSELVSQHRAPPASGRLRCDRGHCHTRAS